MKVSYFIANLKSHYCKFVFALSWIMALKVVPEVLIKSPYAVLIIIFNTVFAFSITCLVRNLKEKALTTIRLGGSLLGIITSVIGVSALQVCGLSNPVCGASIGFGFLATLFPSLMIHYSDELSLLTVVLGILIQAFALYKMRCLRMANR